jgi:hypothetical protein
LTKNSIVSSSKLSTWLSSSSVSTPAHTHNHVHQQRSMQLCTMDLLFFMINCILEHINLVLFQVLGRLTPLLSINQYQLIYASSP